MSSPKKQENKKIYPGLVKNFVFLGATGAGKSSTCNTIFHMKTENAGRQDRLPAGEGPFAVGNDAVSCTETIFEHICEEKRVNLIDTPDFGDNRYDETKIINTFSILRSVFSGLRERNSRQIDAFIMVVRLTPRAQTLRTDLEKARNLFGTSVFKSMVLLFIYSENIETEDDDNNNRDFFYKFKQMEEISILKEGKGEEPNKDWFCLWDNLNPREGQEEELFKKIGLLQPYTEREFLDMSRKLKLNLIDIQTKKAKRRSHIVNRSAIKELDEMLKDDEERKKVVEKMIDILEMQYSLYRKDFDEFLILDNEATERFMTKVDDLIKQEKENTELKQLGRLVYNVALNKRKLDEEAKREILGLAVRRGTIKIVESTAKELAKMGAQQIVNQAPKFILSAYCNIY